ncbi:hypothetical protein [Catenuloplanes atrovinosus]|uniref:Uncharacterized protein n=1 Tax=Catenuloplanes atrovinosus TaxID=137266 RepID=A0AAE3YLI8_9ACTN|nr:hypothetical protein [Catenuloplanes atrovinosus]MDR7274727.1 hypothetical protein [Catenuloplanes atrovinosus]
MDRLIVMRVSQHTGGCCDAGRAAPQQRVGRAGKGTAVAMFVDRHDGILETLGELTAGTLDFQMLIPADEVRGCTAFTTANWSSLRLAADSCRR